MVNSSSEKSPRIEDWTRFISRDEFETFERNVDRSFSEVGKALDNLGRKIDNISSKGTDWKTIWGGLSVMTSIIIAIGGVIAWGILTRIDVNSASIQKTDDYMRSATQAFYERDLGQLNRIHDLELKVAANSVVMEYTKKSIESQK